MAQDFKKILKVASVLGIATIIFFYALFQSYALVFGIKIKNVNIADGAKTENPVLEITGKAENAVLLTINGRTISVDEGGNFKETIVLLGGYNVISIEAEDKFGNKDEKNYKLIH